jgi:methionyl aminopeptidase
VQKHAESNGYSVVRALVGHGIGKEMHEDPAVPNFGKAGTGVRLKAGTVLCIEPMINMGGYQVDFLSDGWTVETRDKQPSAHYENTVVIRGDGVEILTL